MTTPLSTSNKQTYFPLKNLPLEVKADIVKRVHDIIVEEAVTNCPRQSREDAVREAARGLARLNCVDRDLREVTQDVMNTLPDVEMSATSRSIRSMAMFRREMAMSPDKKKEDPDKQFREGFRRFVKRHNHIEVPFNCLLPDEQEIVLNVLQTESCAGSTQHLKKVKLDLSNMRLDASQTPKNQGTSANASRASWMPAWLHGMIFKNQTDAEAPQPSLFQNLLTTIEVMSRNGNQSLDIDLDLSRTAMNAQDVTALAKELPKCKVSSLNLSGNKIGDEGAKAIANALPHSPLISLKLWGNRIGDKGVIAIANALPHSPLTDLDFHGNRIGDEGVIAIANALPHSPLTYLDFHGNQIGDEGARAIARAIARAMPHSRLTNLDLCFNQITDEGAIAIAIALPDSRLTSLVLRFNQIADEGVLALAKAVPDSKLTSLDVSDNKIMWTATKVEATQIAQQGPNPPTVYF